MVSKGFEHGEENFKRVAGRGQPNSSRKELIPEHTWWVGDCLHGSRLSIGGRLPAIHVSIGFGNGAHRLDRSELRKRDPRRRRQDVSTERLASEGLLHRRLLGIGRFVRRPAGEQEGHRASYKALGPLDCPWNTFHVGYLAMGENVCYPEILHHLPDPVQSKAKTGLMQACQIAYMRAVCAQACFTLAKYEEDYDKVDIVTHRIGLYMHVSMQLKSVIDRGDSHLYVDIDRDTYNEFRRRDTYKRYLLLMVLPREEKWIEVNPELLVIKKCMYWVDIKGHAAISTESKRIHFNAHQVVTPEWLCSIADELKRQSLEEEGDQ